MNGLSGPADAGWEPSLMAESPCEEVYGLISLPGSCLGPALITQLLLQGEPHTHTYRQILSFKLLIALLGEKASAVTEIFHVVGCSCLGRGSRVIKTIEQCPQVTSEEKLVSNLRKQECSHQHSTFKMVSNKAFMGGKKDSWRDTDTTIYASLYYYTNRLNKQVWFWQ